MRCNFLLPVVVFILQEYWERIVPKTLTPLQALVLNSVGPINILLGFSMSVWGSMAP